MEEGSGILPLVEVPKHKAQRSACCQPRPEQKGSPDAGARLVPGLRALHTSR